MAIRTTTRTEPVPDLTDRLELPADVVARLVAYFRACAVRSITGALEDAAAMQLDPAALVWGESMNLHSIADALLAPGIDDADRRVLIQRAGETLRKLGALLG
jgi:hypothetical protein